MEKVKKRKARKMKETRPPISKTKYANIAF